MCLARCCDRTLIFGPVARRGGGGILREAHAVLQRRCLRIVVKQREALALNGEEGIISARSRVQGRGFKISRYINQKSPSVC